MALFLSTFENRLDKKGRVSVPSPFRAALSAQSFQGIVVFRSQVAAALDGCGMDRMEALAASLDGLDLFSQARDDLAATIFADARQLPFDSEGRVMLPEDMVAHLGVSERCAFVGRGPTFQIWEPSAFRSQREAARARLAEAGPVLRLSGGTA